MADKELKHQFLRVVRHLEDDKPSQPNFSSGTNEMMWPAEVRVREGDKLRPKMR